MSTNDLFGDVRKFPDADAGDRFDELAGLDDVKSRLITEAQVLICPSILPRAHSSGEPLLKRNLLRRWFHPLVARAGLPRLRFHNLRHAHASLLLAAGVHPKVVRERLGHSQVSVTLDTSSHVAPSLQREAAERLDAVLGA